MKDESRFKKSLSKIKDYKSKEVKKKTYKLQTCLIGFTYTQAQS